MTSVKMARHSVNYVRLNVQIGVNGQRSIALWWQMGSYLVNMNVQNLNSAECWVVLASASWPHDKAAPLR